MRNAFADEMVRIAQERSEVVLLCGDIGNRLFDRFKDVAPGRFLNCGVAEANMVGMAAGMAACGLRPVCYTIAPFLTYRVIEQIRLDLAYHSQRVVIVGTGAGLAYASLGATHHSPEDMGMLRLIPSLAVVAPGDPMELRSALREALDWDGPVYLRIGKKGEKCVHPEMPKNYRIGSALRVRDGKEVWILSLGNTLPLAMETSNILAGQGIACGVVSMGSLKPLDSTVLSDVFGNARVVATLEEHSLLGGLRTAVAEWRGEQRTTTMARALAFGLPDRFLPTSQGQESARKMAGMSSSSMADVLLRALMDSGHGSAVLPSRPSSPDAATL